MRSYGSPAVSTYSRTGADAHAAVCNVTRAALMQIASPAADWTASIIDREQRNFLASFEERFVIDIDTLGATLSAMDRPDPIARCSLL